MDRSEGQSEEILGDEAGGVAPDVGLEGEGGLFFGGWRGEKHDEVVVDGCS